MLLVHLVSTVKVRINPIHLEDAKLATIVLQVLQFPLNFLHHLASTQKITQVNLFRVKLASTTHSQPVMLVSLAKPVSIVMNKVLQTRSKIAQEEDIAKNRQVNLRNVPLKPSIINLMRKVSVIANHAYLENTALLLDL